MEHSYSNTEFTNHVHGKHLSLDERGHNPGASSRRVPLFIRLLSVWAAPILLLCMNLDEVLQIKSLDVVVSLCIQQSEVVMHILRIGLVVVNLSVSRIPK